ncbi:MAG TPA: hypothetical protein V6C89_07620 [Drouetiella sp.]|jgi:hypothetical protein
MDYLENSVFKSKVVVFDQLSLWLIIGVVIIFFAGTIFGRLTDKQPTKASTPQAQHHSVYGRFGSLHWDN